MIARKSLGSFFSLASLALVCCLLGMKADIVQAQSPKTQPPLPIKGPVSADLLRLIGAAPQAVGPVAGVTPDLMQWDGSRVGVTITARNPEALVPALKQLGMRKISVAQEHHLLEGMIPPGALPHLQELTRNGLLGVDPMTRPWVQVGQVTSQADFTHETERSRRTPPMGDGAGVKIGVLSDSFNALGGAGGDQTNGDLPNVQVIQDDGTSDEGRGMLQLIHDLAPGSPLAFATANGGETNFANNIRNLANSSVANCDIIVDDVIYFAEPMFQDGIIAQAANDVVTQNGVAFFSSAGNQANRAWETTSPNVGTDPGVTGNFVDFDPGAGVDRRQRITFPANRRVTLSFQWNDPFYTTNGVDTDLGILFLTPGTNTVIATIDGNNITSQRPVEIVQATSGANPQVFDMMIRVSSGPAPQRVKWIPFGSPTAEFANNSGTVYGHAAAKNAMAVGAAPYFDQRNLESFSSFGPSPILFQANGTPLGAPDIRPKPDFTAIDGCNTTFFGQDAENDGFPNFFGTSASAPHAAAIAALVKQANPGFSPQDIYDRLIDTATDMGAAGVDNQSGAGMINAFDALFPLANANLPFSDGFETGALSQSWDTQSTGAGRIAVTHIGGPAVGAAHIALDSLQTGVASLNEMILNLNTQAGANLTLAFRQKEFSDTDQAMPASFNGSSNTDGVAISVNGTNWFRVVSLTGADSTNTYRDVSFNLTQIAQAAGVNIGTRLLVKFQQFGDRTVANGGGMVFDDVRVTAAATEGPDLFFHRFKSKYVEGRRRRFIQGPIVIRNQGTQKSEKCVLKFFLSVDGKLDRNTDTLLREVNLPAFPKKGGKRLREKFVLTPGVDFSGQHFFAVIDSENQVAELDETNNIGHVGPFK